MKKLIFIALMLIPLTACNSDPARERQTAAVDKLSDEADRQVGQPGLTDFAPKRFVRDIYERTDKTTTTYAYVQGLDGKLTCLGVGVGYGVPFGTRSTPPDGRLGVSEFAVAQPEPNGLYLPDGANATWWQMLNPDTGKIDVVYIEPNVTISPFEIKSPAVSSGC